MSKQVWNNLLLVLGGLLLWLGLSLLIPDSKIKLLPNVEPYLTPVNLELDTKTLESLQLDQAAVNR